MGYFLTNECIKSAAYITDILGDKCKGYEARESRFLDKEEGQKYVLEATISDKINNTEVNITIIVYNNGLVRMDIPANYKEYANRKLNDNKFKEYTSSKEKAGLAQGECGIEQLKHFEEDYKKIFMPSISK